MYSRDTKVLIDLLWFNVMQLVSVFLSGPYTLVKIPNNYFYDADTTLLFYKGSVQNWLWESRDYNYYISEFSLLLAYYRSVT